MSSWMGLLPLDIQDVIYQEPPGEIKEGETSLGIVTSEESKRLWAYAQMLKKEADLLSVDVKYVAASAEQSARIIELYTKGRAVETIFWVGVLDDLKLWGSKNQPALRAGWNVVEPPPNPMQFLQLFGGPQQ